MVQGLSGKRRLLVRFQDGCEKDMTLNQLTVVTVEKVPMTEEYEVPMISAIPCETIYLKKVLYHGVYVIFQFNNEDIVGRKEEQVEMEADPDEEKWRV